MMSAETKTTTEAAAAANAAEAAMPEDTEDKERDVRNAQDAPGRPETGAAPARAPRSLQGRVVRLSGDKTITVLIERKIKHPLYKKYVRRSTKVHAHDEDNRCQPGDTVIVQACRPLSKLKCWRLVEVVGKAA